jgi:predicted GIY-YIG superfamily endonuclease
MPDYLNSKIYMITSSAGLPYIGATAVALNERLRGHKENNCASKIHIGQPDCKIELLENFPCNSKNELNARERYWIDNIECCNNNRPIINKDEYLEYQKSWYENNKNIILSKRKEYRETMVTCFCGRIVGKDRMRNHLKSTIHVKATFELMPFCEIIPIRSYKKIVENN